MRRFSYGGGAALAALVAIVAIAPGCGRTVLYESDEGEGGGDAAAGADGAGAGSTGQTGAGTGAGAGAGSGTGAGAGSGTGAGAGSGTGSGSGAGSGAGAGSGTGAGAGSGTSVASSVSASSGMEVCPGLGDACTECLSASCGSIYCKCYNNPDCFPLITCLNSCGGSSACKQACYIKFPNGAADLAALSGCAGEVCPDACPNSQPLEPCSQCLVETCADEYNACLADTPCISLYQCLDNCGQLDLTCQQGCYATYGAGVPKLQALLQCAKMSCPSC